MVVALDYRFSALVTITLLMPPASGLVPERLTWHHTLCKRVHQCDVMDLPHHLSFISARFPQITSLSCGRLKKATADGGPVGDVLCVGTPSSLQVYDVANNADLFYKEVGGS